jgi:hypothetical protein
VTHVIHQFPIAFLREAFGYLIWIGKFICGWPSQGSYLVDVPTTRGHIMVSIANADVFGIVVTPEMLRAGVLAVLRFDQRFGTNEEWAESVFRAMWAARQTVQFEPISKHEE